jgi:hypothetical protein
MNNIDKNVVSNCMQGCINTYNGRWGTVRNVFDTVTVHKEGKVTWHEAYKDNKLYIIFQGTHNLEGWEDDFDYQQIPVFGKDCLIHKGFYQDELSLVFYQILAIASTFNGEIIVSGHSLGGALAVLCAFKLKLLTAKIISCVAIAGPRVGNKVFKRLYNSSNIPTMLFRYKNDAVSKVPPRVFIGVILKDKKFLGIFKYTPAIVFYNHVNKVIVLGKMSWLEKIKTISFFDHKPQRYSVEMYLEGFTTYNYKNYK